MQISPQLSAALAAATLVGAGCEIGERYESDRFLDETVALDGAGAVVLDVPVPVVVRGVGGLADLTVTGTITVTTSSAARSRTLAEELTLGVDRSGGILTARLPVPGRGAGTRFPEATLQGSLEISVPDDRPLRVIQRGGTVRVDGHRDELRIESIGPVQVLDALASVAVGAVNGPVEVRTRAAPGTRTVVQMTGGSEARVVLPRGLNARVVAQTGDGRVILSHPELPGGSAEPYDQTVGAALAEVEVTAGRGNIVLLAN